MDAKTALQLVLDHVDFTVGNCLPNEMVAAVLPTNILQMAKAALEPDAKPRVEIKRVDRVDVIDYWPPEQDEACDLILFRQRNKKPYILEMVRTWNGETVDDENGYLNRLNAEVKEKLEKDKREKGKYWTRPKLI